MKQAKQTKGRQARDGAEVRRVQVMLDEETIDRARALGQGNVSQGIRKAVASLPNDTETDKTRHDSRKESNHDISDPPGVRAR